jgi:protein-disulfide isomerase
MDQSKLQSKPPLSKRQAMREERARKAFQQRLFVIGGIVVVLVLFFGLLFLTNNQQNTDTQGGLVKITPVSYPNMNGVKVGNPEAQVTLDIFEDFKCSACQAYTLQIEPQVMKELVETGKVLYVFHNYPFEDDKSTTVKDSDMAANAAMCAAEQNRLWDYKLMTFTNLTYESGEYSEDRLVAFATSLKMNTKDFTTCLREKRYQAQIDQDIAMAQEKQITGTPSLFVNGVAVTPGYVPTIDQIKAAVEAALTNQ